METVTEISAELADFVQKMGESVADAKRQIDNASIEALKTLAETNMTIPLVTKSIEDGKVVYTTEEVPVSPLSLGMMPTFYEFQKTDIEVSMDFEISEDTTVKAAPGNKDAPAYRKIGKIGVNTKRVRQERRIKSDIKGYSSLKIEMVPVPPPSTIPDLFIDNTNVPAANTPTIPSGDTNA